MLVVLAEEGPHEELPSAFLGAKESYLPSPILFPSVTAPCPSLHSVTDLFILMCEWLSVSSIWDSGQGELGRGGVPGS